MNIVSISDVFRFAIKLEENGELFYHKAAMEAEDKEITDLFNQLADEEIRHRHTFEDMAAKVENEPARETFRGEYLVYLRDYIDTKGFFSKAATDQGKSAVNNTVSALDFAIGREMDSIFFYQEIKQFVPEKHHGAIDIIIAEERKHFSKLSETKKRYS